MGVLRILLALSVLIGHSSPLFGVILLPPEMAVQLFFVISGFYMALILEGKYVGPGSTLLFYKNRMLRLYPTYFVVMVAGWVWFGLVWIYRAKLPQNNWLEPYSAMSPLEKLPFVFSNWTMFGLDLQCLFYIKPGVGIWLMDGPLPELRNDGAVWTGHFRAVDQAWSVGAEIWFYILAPALVRSRSWGLILIALLSAALRYKIDSIGPLYGYFFFGSQIYFFVIGMLLLRYFKRPDFERCSGKWLVVWAGGLVLFTILAGSFHVGPLHWILYPFFIGILPHLFAWSKDIEWDRKLGDLSYPIYMAHMIVAGILATAFHIRSSAVVAPVAIAAAWLLWRWVECPVNRLRQRYMPKAGPNAN